MRLRTSAHPSALARQSSSLLLATLASSALSFAFVVVVANAAGVDARGGLAFLVTVPTLLSFAATMGLETANLHYAARDPALRTSLAGLSLIRGLGWGSALGAGAGGVLALSSSIVPDAIPDWAVALSLLATPLMCVQFLLVSLLTASEALGRANVVRAVIPLVSLGVFALLAGTGHRGLGAAATAWFCGQAAGAAAALGATIATIGPPVIARSRRTVPGVAGYGLRAHVGNLADLATFRTDALVLAGFWGAHELGIYAAAVNVAEVTLILPTAVATVLLPHRSRPGTATSATTRAVVFVAGVTALVAAAGAAAAPWVIDLLYPEEFAGAVTPLRVLLLAMVGMSVRRVLAAEFAALRRQTAASAIAVVTFLTVLVLDLVLIPRHGAPGAAWASAAGYALGGVVIVAVGARIARLASSSPADPGAAGGVPPSL